MTRWQAYLLPLRAHWQALSAREQRGLSVLAVLLSAVLFWFVAIDPALHTLRTSAQRSVQVSEQQAHMLALQAEAQALQARTPLAREEALRQLQGLAPNTQFQLNVQGERVAVQLKGVSATGLSNWLAQARQQAQALPVEAHLTRNPVTGTPTTASSPTWDGNLVLSLPARGQPAP
jgi:general secretion pathway protein M